MCRDGCCKSEFRFSFRVIWDAPKPHPSNTIGFSDIASVDAFSDQLSKQLAAVKRLLHGDDDSPISNDYGPQAVLEWEDTLKNTGTDNDDRQDS